MVTRPPQPAGGEASGQGFRRGHSASEGGRPDRGARRSEEPGCALPEDRAEGATRCPPGHRPAVTPASNGEAGPRDNQMRVVKVAQLILNMAEIVRGNRSRMVGGCEGIEQVAQPFHRDPRPVRRDYLRRPPHVPEGGLHGRDMLAQNRGQKDSRRGRRPAGLDVDVQAVVPEVLLAPRDGVGELVDEQGAKRTPCEGLLLLEPPLQPTGRLGGRSVQPTAGLPERVPLNLEITHPAGRIREEPEPLPGALAKRVFQGGSQGAKPAAQPAERDPEIMDGFRILVARLPPAGLEPRRFQQDMLESTPGHHAGYGLRRAAQQPRAECDVLVRAQRSMTQLVLRSAVPHLMRSTPRSSAYPLRGVPDSGTR